MRLLAIEAGDRDASREELLEREILQIADREKQRFGRELHGVLRSQPLAGSAALSAALLEVWRRARNQGRSRRPTRSSGSTRRSARPGTLRMIFV